MVVPIGKFTFSLTGKDSHKVDIDAGQGSFSIAPKSLGRKADAYIEADIPILWNAFDELTTPAGSNWPRFFYYIGNDSSFIEWSRHRDIEDFHWTMLASTNIDLTGSNISRLMIENDDFPLTIRLNENMRLISFKGNPHKITIEEPSEIKRISFSLNTQKNILTPISLPDFSNLKSIESIEISTPVIGQPFDCASLLQFKTLKSVSLWGNSCNFEALAQMPQLSSIAVRYCSDMSGFPPPSVWQHLNYFIVWNSEEITGKRLKQELKELAKSRHFGYASVSKLRKKIWFETEFNIPFTNWEGKNGREAMKAYKTTLKAIKKAEDEAEAKALLISLIELINTLPDIETVEREDTYQAVSQLAASAPFDIDEEKVQQWFDEHRDF